MYIENRLDAKVRSRLHNKYTMEEHTHQPYRDIAELSKTKDRWPFTHIPGASTSGIGVLGWPLRLRILGGNFTSCASEYLCDYYYYDYDVCAFESWCVVEYRELWRWAYVRAVSDTQ